MLNEHETSSAPIILTPPAMKSKRIVSTRFGPRKKRTSSAIDEENDGDDHRRLKVASVRVWAHRQESFAVYNRDSRHGDIPVARA